MTARPCIQPRRGRQLPSTTPSAPEAAPPDRVDMPQKASARRKSSVSRNASGIDARRFHCETTDVGERLAAAITLRKAAISAIDATTANLVSENDMAAMLTYNSARRARLAAA